jgi:arylsulfatase A-like enzyme
MNSALGPLPTQPDKLACVNFYANLQKKIDRQLGEVLDLLQSRRLFKNTVIFRLAEHGEMPSRTAGSGKGLRGLRGSDTHSVDRLQPSYVSQAATDEIPCHAGRYHADAGGADEHHSPA